METANCPICQMPAPLVSIGQGAAEIPCNRCGRVYFINDLHEQGMGLAQIQEAVGHSSESSTRCCIYMPQEMWNAFAQAKTTVPTAQEDS